ncbi:MAG: FKBP-type peptidyl-prolyl cis-trans isomerase [Lachnospiraceae bacterium]|nr:FKBP-type peptidyl-prolyl cis-trans isomerase [Lachnospiraceae bacterium]
MKKRLIALLMCTGLVITAFSGCKKGSDGAEQETGSTEEKTELVWSISREDYFGLEIEESKAHITDEELQKYIDSDLKANAEEVDLKEAPLEMGQYAVIDFEGKTDGKTVISKSDYEIELGAGQVLFEGFDEGLVGKKKGDKFDLTLKYPKDYEDESLREKEIVISVTVDKVFDLNIPELNDEYVKKVYTYLGISTVEEYKAEYKRTIEEKMQYDVLWPLVMKNVVIEIYDSEELKKKATPTFEYYEYMYSQTEGGLAGALEQSGMTEDEFYKKYCEDPAKEEIKYYLIRDYIAETEKIEVTDEEFEAELKKSMELYDVETKEEFYKKFESQGYDEEYFRDNFLTNKVVQFICENAVVVEDAEKESETAATE